MPLRELRRKYFMTVGGNRWVFFAKDEKGNLIKLIQLGWIEVVRHSLCQHLNPFLAENYEYFEKRRKAGAKQSALLNANQSKLLAKQKGLCPVCGEWLLNDNPLEVHHIKPRALGGKDTLRNLLLLHKVCHKQVTNSKNSTLQAAWIKAGIIKGLVRRAKRPTIMKNLGAIGPLLGSRTFLPER
jgi:RNA-directed DNA polymerase